MGEVGGAGDALTRELEALRRRLAAATIDVEQERLRSDATRARLADIQATLRALADDRAKLVADVHRVLGGDG